MGEPPVLKDTAQDHVRYALERVSGWIPNETVSGLVFGLALVATDHMFNLLKG